MLISGNILENNWTSAQVGYAILLKPGPENIKTVAITTDITITNNIVRHSTGGINILGRNSTGGAVSNVTFAIICSTIWERTGDPRSACSPSSLVETPIIIENNTATQPNLNTALTFDGTDPANNFVMRSNIASPWQLRR